MTGIRFFGLNTWHRDDAMYLDIDYSDQIIEDPAITHKKERLPLDFLSLFQFTISGGAFLGDSVANNLGWYILSQRVVSILLMSKNTDDLNVLPLPSSLVQREPRLVNYKTVGVRRQLECLDKNLSDIRWSRTAPQEFAVAIHRGVLVSSSVPPNCDIFLLKEWPVVPIVRDQIAQKIREAKIAEIELKQFDGS